MQWVVGGIVGGRLATQPGVRPPVTVWTAVRLSTPTWRSRPLSRVIFSTVADREAVPRFGFPWMCRTSLPLPPVMVRDAEGAATLRVSMFEQATVRAVPTPDRVQSAPPSGSATVRLLVSPPWMGSMPE